jgi:O-antigen/teichoic acid export membrane protein
MWIIIVIVGLLFGLFAFSQIIYPLFSAWPKAKKMEREGKLVKPIPISTFIIAPIVWGALLAGSIWIVNKFVSEYTLLYYIVLGFTLVIVIAQIPRKNKNIEADFKDTWKKFLKEEE